MLSEILNSMTKDDWHEILRISWELLTVRLLIEVPEGLRTGVGNLTLGRF